MRDDFDEKMLGLIRLYQQVQQGSNELYRNYRKLMDDYRVWQRENILDYERLVNYSDEEFAAKFWEMFDHSDGSSNSHDRVRGRYFKKPEQRLEARAKFEEAVKHIVEAGDRRFELLEEILDKKGAYKIRGLGTHMMTTLINAQYPDVPMINDTTAQFFRWIGRKFPEKLPERQRVVSEFFNEMVALSGGELNFDDVNLMLWFAKNDDAAEAYMRRFFGER